MSVLLLPNGCFLSESSRMLELHKAFTRRGLSVTSATHGGSFARVYEDAGIELVHLGTITPQRQRQMVANVPGMQGPHSDMWSADELRTQVRAELDLIKKLDPQVVVTGWTLSSLISAKVAGLPLVTEHAGLWLPPLWENNRLPVPSKKVSPILHVLPPKLATRAFNWRITRNRWHLGPINQVCREFGVEPLPSFAGLVMGDLTLVMDMPEMFGFSQVEVEAWKPRQPSKYRSGVRLAYAGPLFAKLDIPVPERVTQFLQRRPIYVAMTSTPGHIVRAVVERLRRLDRPLLIASLGQGLEDLESNDVMVEDLLPNHLVVPQVALLVGAGGHGTLQTAMAAGVPFLGVPLQPEQDVNIVLAERHGAARLVSLKHAQTHRIADVAAEMLATDTYLAAAERMASAYRTVDGAEAAVDAILKEIP